MKMQKTEMEFVTFDARDVIATSNGPTSISFQVTEDLFDLEKGWIFDNEYDSLWVPAAGGGRFYIWDNTDGHRNLDIGEYYTIEQGAVYSTYFKTWLEGDKTGDLSISSGLTRGNTGTPYTSLKAIIDWLGTNGVPQ